MISKHRKHQICAMHKNVKDFTKQYILHKSVVILSHICSLLGDSCEGVVDTFTIVACINATSLHSEHSTHIHTTHMPPYTHSVFFFHFLLSLYFFRKPKQQIIQEKYCSKQKIISAPSKMAICLRVAHWHFTPQIKTLPFSFHRPNDFNMPRSITQKRRDYSSRKKQATDPKTFMSSVVYTEKCIHK